MLLQLLLNISTTQPTSPPLPQFRGGGFTLPHSAAGNAAQIVWDSVTVTKIGGTLYTL